MSHIINILKGMVIGIANAIPGVSGGTMAVVLKIYDRLLGAINLNLKKLKENWKFLLTIGIGMGLGIFLTAVLLKWLFETYAVATNLFFVGIIIGSIPMILKETKSDGKIKPVNWIFAVLGLGLILGIAFVNADNISNEIQTTLTVPLFFFLLIVMFVAAVAMIIPGISGSFVALVLGGYQTVITAVGDLNIPILIPAAIGAALGILGGAKMISVLLEKHRQAVYMAILGLVAGSLYVIFPKNFSFNAEGIVGIFVLLVGIALPILMELPGKKKTQ